MTESRPIPTSTFRNDSTAAVLDSRLSENYHTTFASATTRTAPHTSIHRTGRAFGKKRNQTGSKGLAWSDLHKSQDLETNDKTICGSRTRPRGGAEQASSCKKQFHRPNPRSESESCITAPVRNAQSTRQASTAFQPPPRRLRYPPGRQREQCVYSPPRSPSPSLRRSETTAPIVPVLRVLERRGRPFAARIPAVPRREPLPCLPRLTPLPPPPSAGSGGRGGTVLSRENLGAQG